MGDGDIWVDLLYNGRKSIGHPRLLPQKEASRVHVSEKPFDSSFADTVLVRFMFERKASRVPTVDCFDLRAYSIAPTKYVVYDVLKEKNERFSPRCIGSCLWRANERAKNREGLIPFGTINEAGVVRSVFAVSNLSTHQ